MHLARRLKTSTAHARILRHAGREPEFYGLLEDFQRLGQGTHEKGQELWSPGQADLSV